MTNEQQRQCKQKWRKSGDESPPQCLQAGGHGRVDQEGEQTLTPLAKGSKQDQCGRENNHSIGKNWETRDGVRYFCPRHVQCTLVAGHTCEGRHPGGGWRAVTAD